MEGGWEEATSGLMSSGTIQSAKISVQQDFERSFLGWTILTAS